VPADQRAHARSISSAETVSVNSVKTITSARRLSALASVASASV
jgi:hypothetical protein